MPSFELKIKMRVVLNPKMGLELNPKLRKEKFL